MKIIGQKENVSTINNKIKDFYLGNAKFVRLFILKENDILPCYLAKYVIYKLNLETISINCSLIRSISEFKHRISKISKNSVVFLQNYEKLKKPIRDYFELFINKEYKNENINHIKDRLSFIITLNKRIETNLKADSILMDKYSHDDLIEITKSLMDKLNVDEQSINIHSLLNMKFSYDPKYIYRQVILFKRYYELSDIVKHPAINYHNFFKVSLLTWNRITILDLVYLLSLDEDEKNNDSFNSLKRITSSKKVNSFIKTYLSLNNYISSLNGQAKLTIKGFKIVNQVNKSKTILNHLIKLEQSTS